MKTKYIKVAVSERLPFKNLYVVLIDGLGNACNGYYSEKNNWIISTEGYFSTIEYWLEEVPDYEEEMKDVLLQLVGCHTCGHKIPDWLNDKAEELLTKIKQQS